ncbi:beta-mannosidase [Fictibacillus sp. S7]|uniref:beta-mannosidase n=1 Tax=Fictibacillus sp. S7 TaxID=2212476 RepID=UPI00101205DF|nr:glycoside hydrolase family 2 protein [Fictibacillus sp. S7]RXZ01725.1 beta-mannosidase [Fictibacillus sp. S7]
MKLSGEWKLKWFEPGKVPSLEIAAPSYIDHFWMGASVPGDVHSELLKKRLIEDPFVGHNDLASSWVEEKEWWYRTTFLWEDECLDEEYLHLIFEGLDTYATIFLNGKEIGITENMLVEHTFEVTRQVQQGKNVIAVKFDPIAIHMKNKEKDYWCSYGKERIWTRKAAMNFGWDWGPRLVTAGIWKDVSLKKYTKAHLEGVHAKTVKVEEDKALIEVEADIKQSFKNKETLSLSVELRSGTEVVTSETDVLYRNGRTTMEVPQPKLWWTHDLGDPYLYQLRIELKDESGAVLDVHEQSFGIREIKVELTHENGENLFAFNLNGVRIFAKGANWIPVHSFIGSAEDSRYTKLLELAKDAHMNMMRVWGGGIYEKDIFYKECDRLGLLVWQDFMFANALYPDYNRNFMLNVKDEITKVIKRLRNYSCLAIWCGNNEIDWIYDRKHSDGEITTPFYGERIYHEVIPELLTELDPGRLYWPSSPFGSSGESDLDDETVGDRHNWVVWHGNVEPRKKGEPVIQDISLEGVSFKQYKKDYTLFSSEFGMHASSNSHTLSKYIPEGEFYWKSAEMSYRNKDHFHEKGILLMEGFTGVPDTIEEYMNYSMLTQAEGLKYGIEHYRRRKPYTSGALIWQLNDCWPGTSWSMVDYELLPKASYYYAKRFFAPVLVTLDHDPGSDIELTVINDQLQPVNDSVTLEVLDFNGETVFSRKLDFESEGNSVLSLFKFTEEEILQGKNAGEVIVCLSSRNGAFPENRYYLRDFKEMNYPEAHLEIEESREQNTITVRADKLARFVKIDVDQEEVLCSDNFFDLLPGEEKNIRIHSLKGHEFNLESLRVSAINADSMKATETEAIQL